MEGRHMNETAYSIQLGYMLDTDADQFRDLTASSPALRDRLVDAGIEHARRASGLSVPRGIGAGANWKPVRHFGCCAQAGVGNLFDHCKGAEHVAAEYGLSEAAVPSMEALAQLLSRARLDGPLSKELDESGLRGAILGALNDSWRRLYLRPEHQLRSSELGDRSSDEVFAERVARRAGRQVEEKASHSPYMSARMAPGV